MGNRRRRTVLSSSLSQPQLVAQAQAQMPQWLPNREHAAIVRTHMQNHLEAIKNNAQANVNHSKKYLESVGQYLQQALSPFGINCDYHVDGRTSVDNVEQSTETTSTTDTGRTSTGNVHNETCTTANVGVETNTTFNTSSIRIDPIQTSATTVHTATSSTIRNPLEKSIDDCIEEMKAMGFNDKDETLIELIRAKHGDLNSVLDAISTGGHSY
jgi:hypothetical protein